MSCIKLGVGETEAKNRSFVQSCLAASLWVT